MNTTEALKVALDALEAMIEFTKPLSNFDGYTRLAQSPTELIKNIQSTIAILSAASAEQQPEWISAELVSYAGSTHPNPDMICRNLATNQMFLCDPWVGCALPHEVRPEIGTLINFREGPWRENVYLPHVAQIVGKAAPSAPQASQPSAWDADGVRVTAYIKQSGDGVGDYSGADDGEPNCEFVFNKDGTLLSARSLRQQAPAQPSIAAAIKYPDEWDTAAYPTLESALHELAAWHKASLKIQAEREKAVQQAPAVQEDREALASEARKEADEWEAGAYPGPWGLMRKLADALTSHPAPAQTAPEQPSICSDVRFMAALDGYMDAVTADPRNTDRRIKQRLEIFAAADAWHVAQQAQTAPVNVPSGWKLVPKEPTRAMCLSAAEAAREYLELTGGNSPVVIYRTMLSAAPSAPAAPSEDAGWISVKDRLPEKKPHGKTFVWCYGPTIEGFNNVIMARFSDKDFFAAGEGNKLKPTHWMPLPPAPIAATAQQKKEGE